MAKLYFHYATMGAGKSALLLQTEYNYRERGMRCLLLTAQVDTRAGMAKISSRLGLEAAADTFSPDDDLMDTFLRQAAGEGVAAVLVDEAQFLTPAQVWQLAEGVDLLGLPVLCYGLRTDFRGELFAGSRTLLATADELREMRTICHCGSKATHVMRKAPDGTPVFEGDQVQIGGNESYVALCRKHWRAAWLEARRSARRGRIPDSHQETGAETSATE